MCKYQIQINNKYGNMMINAGDNYSEAINKYKEVKDEYASITCDINFLNDGKIQCQKKNDNSMEKLYDNLLDVLVKIAEHEIEMSEKEEEFNRAKNANYHMIEELDTSKLSDEEQLDIFKNMKTMLTKRRSIESENQKAYAFHDTFLKIYDAIENYENKDKCKVNKNISRFKDQYYRESPKNKQKRLSNLQNRFSL